VQQNKYLRLSTWLTMLYGSLTGGLLAAADLTSCWLSASGHLSFLLLLLLTMTVSV